MVRKRRNNDKTSIWPLELNPDKKLIKHQLKLLTTKFYNLSGFIYLSGFPRKTRYRHFRGKEFTNPTAIELSSDGQIRTNVFYCDPMCSWQKGECEVNHELIRRIVPKGKVFDNFSQTQINLMMNHINSYTRKKLGNRTPYEVFKEIYGLEIIKKLGINFIQADEVTLKPSLLK